MDQVLFTGYHEGMKEHAYIDSRGFWTIGRGHKFATPLEIMLVANLGTKLRISGVQADELVGIDLQQAENDFARVFIYDPERTKTVINPARRIALVDMLFNLGRGQFLKFKNMIKAVRRGDWAAAAHEVRDSRWFYQVGDGAGKLADRGERVAYILEKGELPSEGHRLYIDYARYAGRAAA